MEEMKFYTHEEMLDRVIGKKVLPERDKYDDKMEAFLVEKPSLQKTFSNVRLYIKRNHGKLIRNLFTCIFQINSYLCT